MQAKRIALFSDERFIRTPLPLRDFWSAGGRGAKAAQLDYGVYNAREAEYKKDAADYARIQVFNASGRKEKAWGDEQHCAHCSGDGSTA